MTHLPALSFFSVSAFLLAFGLWTAEQQFTHQDKINQEVSAAWDR